MATTKDLVRDKLDLKAAQEIRDALAKIIGQSLNPSTQSTSEKLREFAFWVIQQAEKDGITLSEDDYAELIKAIAQVDLGFRVKFLLAELIGQQKASSEWSAGVSTMRQYTFIERND